MNLGFRNDNVNENELRLEKRFRCQFQEISSTDISSNAITTSNTEMGGGNFSSIKTFSSDIQNGRHLYSPSSSSPTGTVLILEGDKAVNNGQTVLQDNLFSVTYKDIGKNDSAPLVSNTQQSIFSETDKFGPQCRVHHDGRIVAAVYKRKKEEETQNVRKIVKISHTESNWTTNQKMINDSTLSSSTYSEKEPYKGSNSETYRPSLTHTSSETCPNLESSGICLPSPTHKGSETCHPSPTHKGSETCHPSLESSKTCLSIPKGSKTCLSSSKDSETCLSTSKAFETCLSTSKASEICLSTSKASDTCLSTPKSFGARFSTSKGSETCLSTSKGSKTCLFITKGSKTCLSSYKASETCLSTSKDSETCLSTSKASGTWLSTSKASETCLSTSKASETCLSTSKASDTCLSTPKGFEVCLTNLESSKTCLPSLESSKTCLPNFQSLVTCLPSLENSVTCIPNLESSETCLSNLEVSHNVPYSSSCRDPLNAKTIKQEQNPDMPLMMNGYEVDDEMCLGEEPPPIPGIFTNQYSTAGPQNNNGIHYGGGVSKDSVFSHTSGELTNMDYHLKQYIGENYFRLFKQFQSSYEWIVLNFSNHNISCSSCKCDITDFFLPFEMVSTKLYNHHILEKHILTKIVRNPEKFCQVLEFLKFHIKNMQTNEDLLSGISLCLGHQSFTYLDLKVLLRAIKEVISTRLTVFLSKRNCSLNIDVCRGFTVCRMIEFGHPVEHLLPRNFACEGRVMFCHKNFLCETCKSPKQSKTIPMGALNMPSVFSLSSCLMNIPFLKHYVALLANISELYNTFQFYFSDIPKASMLAYPDLENMDAFWVIATQNTKVKDVCKKIFDFTGNMRAFGISVHPMQLPPDLYYVISFYNYINNFTTSFWTFINKKEECFVRLDQSYNVFKKTFCNAAVSQSRDQSDVNQVLEIFHKYIAEIRKNMYYSPVINMTTIQFLFNPFALSSLRKNPQDLDTLQKLYNMIKVKDRTFSTCQSLIQNLTKFGQALEKRGPALSVNDFLNIFADKNICQEFSQVKDFYWTLLLLPFFPAKQNLPFIALDITSSIYSQKYGAAITEDLLLLQVEGPKNKEDIKLVRDAIVHNMMKAKE